MRRSLYRGETREREREGEWENDLVLFSLTDFLLRERAFHISFHWGWGRAHFEIPFLSLQSTI